MKHQLHGLHKYGKKIDIVYLKEGIIDLCIKCVIITVQSNGLLRLLLFKRVMKFLGTSFNLYRRMAIEVFKIELFRCRRYSVAMAKANSTCGDL